MMATIARPQSVSLRIEQQAADANDTPTGMNLKASTPNVACSFSKRSEPTAAEPEPIRRTFA